MMPVSKTLRSRRNGSFGDLGGGFGMARPFGRGAGQARADRFELLAVAVAEDLLEQPERGPVGRDLGVGEVALLELAARSAGAGVVATDLAVVGQQAVEEVDLGLGPRPDPAVQGDRPGDVAPIGGEAGQLVDRRRVPGVDVERGGVVGLGLEHATVRLGVHGPDEEGTDVGGLGRLDQPAGERVELGRPGVGRSEHVVHQRHRDRPVVERVGDLVDRRYVAVVGASPASCRSHAGITRSKAVVQHRSNWYLVARSALRC